MLIVHKQTAKQNNSGGGGGGGGASKKNNPRRNRGGGNNKNANVSLTNVSEPTNTEDVHPVEASQNKPNIEVISKTPALTNNGCSAAVWFVLSSIGDNFDDSVEGDIFWAPEESNKQKIGCRFYNQSKSSRRQCLP